MNQPSKIPGLVKWVGYLTLTFLLMLPLAVVIVRSGAWQPGLLLYALGCLGSLLLLLLCLILLLLPRFAPWRKVIAQRGLFALPGTLLLLALASGGDAPRIHDITTDTRSPPTFTMAEQERGAGANSLEIDPKVIEQQKLAYPDVQTLASTLTLDDAFSRSLQIATEMGWEIYHQDRDIGVIEAVDTTLIMGFKDDVVIRLRGDGSNSRLDLRSVSRVGEGDIGANAKRIHAFFKAYQDAD